MTLQQKLQGDLINEQAAMDAALRALETAKTAVREHEVRLAYIRECLGLTTNREPTAPKAKTHAEPHNGHGVDIDQAIAQAFHQNSKWRMQALVTRVIELGYLSPDAEERARKNVSSFLLRKAKHPDTTGFRRVGRGMFEYTEPGKD